MKMEFSTYFYHSNRNPYCITFINNKKGSYKIIVSIINAEDYVLDNERIFVISYDELKHSKNLYKIYVLSLLMTYDTKELSYSDGIEIMDCKWCIKTIQNWKGLYFTQHYNMRYGFHTYPTEIDITDIGQNDIIKSYYMNEFDKDDYIFVSCNSKVANAFLNDNIGKYIHDKIIKLEGDIKDIERKIYSMKKYKIFIEKVCKYKTPKDDIAMIIFSHIIA